MAKAFECVCLQTNYIAIIFAKSEKSARNIFTSKYKLLYCNPFVCIERVEELDYLNRKDGYILDWNNREDRLALLKIGYSCGDLKDPMDICENCFYCEDCEPYKEFKIRSVING